MSRDNLQRFFDTSPAVRLLRSPNAAWILDFLQEQFKLSGQIIHSHSNLAEQLELYLLALADRPVHESAAEVNGVEQIREHELRGKAEAYLADWCAADCGWLKRFIDQNQSEPIYQLTSDTEMVLAFVRQGAGPSKTIPTRSRLRSILSLLDEVVRSGDHASLVREQFSLAVSQLEQLTGEFRAVEERFRSITRGVQQRILASGQSRGDILQFALDAEELLRSGEHGQGFFEFLKLVHDPANQQRISELVEQLMRIDSLAARHEELHLLQTMIPTLLSEAEKILRTTQHLSQTLRRLLDARSTRHQQQLTQVLRDIRAQATALAQAPPRDISLEIEAEIDIQLPYERVFWSRAEPFAEVQLQLAEIDPQQHALALKQLAALERIDWQTLRRNVSQAVQRSGQTTISELLQQFPIRSGAVELLGYLQIAHDDGHVIDSSQKVELQIQWEGPRARTLSMPQVIFRQPSTARSNSRQTSGAQTGDDQDEMPTCRKKNAATIGEELK